MAVVNVDQYLTDQPVRNRVVRVGFEIEGMWDKPVVAKHPLVRDSSVFKSLVDAGGLSRKLEPTGMYGEIHTSIISPIEIAPLMKKLYPKKIDETCGLHLHMSFDTLLPYSLLASSESYQDTLIEYLKWWGTENAIPPGHHFWGRLEGNSEYCQKKWWPELQFTHTTKEFDKAKEGHRYTVLSFEYQRLGTVECRVLPMFDTPEKCSSALLRIIKVTNGYLLSVEKKRLKEKMKITKQSLGSTKISLELRKGRIYEEYEEE